jgi:hypothetical protein
MKLLNMKIKLLTSFCVVLLCRVCLGGLADAPKAIGEWSEPTNGLRARILFGEDTPLYGSRRGVIYLELQNLRNVSFDDTLAVYYDSTNPTNSPVQSELRDSHGKVITYNGMCVYSGGIPSGRWLMLPHDSTLRLRVTLAGFWIPRNSGIVIPGSGTVYLHVIPRSETNDCYLFATLNITSPKNEHRLDAWEGALKLPPVRIPVNP